MSFWPYLAWVLMLNREYCPVARYSVRWPATVLLKGIDQKLVAVTLPVLVVRKTFSKSTKPPGVNSAAPMRNESGDSLGFSSCTSLATALAVAGAVVVSVAFSTCGVPAVFSSSALVSLSICCCCWAICWCCWAIASRNAFNSAATDVGSDGAFCAVVWANINPGARTRKQILATHLIEAISSLLNGFYRFSENLVRLPDVPSSGAG